MSFSLYTEKSNILEGIIYVQKKNQLCTFGIENMVLVAQN